MPKSKPTAPSETSRSLPPAEWTAFRERIREADAVLFVTPEHNRSVPSALKNAIDIGSRPYGKSAWHGKPGAVISASPGSGGGFGANHHLRQSLVFLNVPTMAQPEAYIGGADKLFDSSGKCIEIPSQDHIPAAAKVRAFPIVERHKWVWVWMGDPALADANLVPDTHYLDDPGWRGTPGYFAQTLSMGKVAGPLITTQSRFDTAVGKFYPIGSGLAGQVVYDLEEDGLPTFGGAGSFGIRGLGERGSVQTKMLGASGAYPFEAGKIYNLDSNEFIKNGDGASGAHSDISGPEVAHAIWQAAIAGSKG